jgi:soluble lytic murein transglycosylase-like protein
MALHPAGVDINKHLTTLMILFFLPFPASAWAKGFVRVEGGSRLRALPRAQRTVLSRHQKKIRAIVAGAAAEHGMDPLLAVAVAKVESNLQAAARSPKGARGPMQLMPATAAFVGVADIDDPVDNAQGGVTYLQYLGGRYSGSLVRSLAAYNAGPEAVDRHRGVPPYRETKGYLKAVLLEYYRLKFPHGRPPA